jgi:biofilm PGA synthesis protein PgaD
MIPTTSLIIDKSTTRPCWARVLDLVLSLLIWLVYLYMIREALTDIYLLVNESLHWVFTRSQRPTVPGISRFLGTLRAYGIAVVLNGAVLLAWAAYNQLRFRGRVRRSPAKPVDVQDLAELYRVPRQEIAKWQASRIMWMQHDAEGNLVGVTLKEPARAG